MTRFGRYVVLGTLGRGGMGTVLEAFDRTLDRRVAVKVLHGDITHRHTRRLVREAQALARMSHPNVVQVYETGEIDGQTFVAMELIRGQTLARWAQQDPRPQWQRCVATYLQAAEGLAAIHARDLVHRDFKPANAIVDEQGRVKLVDFGLAREAGDETLQPSIPDDEARPEGDALDTALTKTGTVLGTPAYMPPEQMKGLEIDHRSDQFSYCVSLYEALYGERPFEGSSMTALMLSMDTGMIREVPSGLSVPGSLRTVLRRGLSADPRDRWPSMDALHQELRRLIAPRSKRWLAAGLVMSLAAAGGSVALYAKVGLRCQGAAAQLEGIWDETRKAAVRDAVLGTELTYAADTWTHVESRLDGYAAEWVAAHTAACEATRVTKEQTEDVLELRMGCLSERRVALRAAADVLAHADGERVRKAVDLVSELPRLRRCDDIDVLMEALPPPDDPEIATEVERERERLVEVRALAVMGEPARTEPLVRAVVERAEQLGYGPLRAEALVQAAALYADQGKYEPAERDLERAYLLALEHEHDELVFDVMLALTHVVGVAQARRDDGRQWAEAALALSRRTSASDIDKSNIHSHYGTLLRVGGEPDDALVHHQQALVSLEHAGLVEHPQYARSLANIGKTMQVLGRQDEALTYHRRALAAFEQVRGHRHPTIATQITNVGRVLQSQGRIEEALQLFEHALAIQREALGPTNPSVGMSLMNIGTVHHQRGRLAEALSYQRQALLVLEQSLGPDHPTTSRCLDNIAGALKESNALDDALEHYRRSLAIKERAHGPDHPALAVSLHGIASTLVLSGEFEQAREHHERTLSILEGALGPTHPNLGYPLTGLAEMALSQGDLGAVRVHAGRLVAMSEGADGAQLTHLVLAHARFMLARALWTRESDRLRAHELALQARDDYAGHGEGEEDAAAEIDAWLAEHPAPRGHDGSRRSPAD